MSELETRRALQHHHWVCLEVERHDILHLLYVSIMAGEGEGETKRVVFFLFFFFVSIIIFISFSLFIILWRVREIIPHNAFYHRPKGRKIPFTQDKSFSEGGASRCKGNTFEFVRVMLLICFVKSLMSLESSSEARNVPLSPSHNETTSLPLQSLCASSPISQNALKVLNVPCPFPSNTTSAVAPTK